MTQINTKMIPALEGIKYRRSPAEQDFKKYATFGLVLLFFSSMGHIVLNFFRLRTLNWNPDMNSKDLPDGIKKNLNILEKELASTFLIITFAISVGAFYGG